jgi:hypothetical protein
MIDFKDLFKILPWYWSLWAILLTLVFLIPIGTYTLLAVINPFWFRDAMMWSVTDLIDWTDRLRHKLMFGAIEKYRIFETLKH